MSKGSQVVPLRIPADKLAEIVAAIESANIYTRGEPYSRSSWLMKAVQEKLDHLKRSRYKARRRGK